MKQKLLNLKRLRGLLLLAVMCIFGAGIAWGQTYSELYSATFTEVGTHSYTQNKTFTLNEKSWTASVSQVNGGVFYLGCNSNNASKGILGDNETFSDVDVALSSVDNIYESKKSQAYALLFENAYNNVTKVAFNWAGGNNAFQVYLFGYSGSGFVLLSSTDYATSGAEVSGSVEWEGNATNYTKFAIVARPGTTTSLATNKTLRPSTFTIYETSSVSTCATPTFSPEEGTYTSSQNVTISTKTDGATIYYTLDGSTPTTSSSVYDEPIVVNSTTTIKAMAVKTDYKNSSVASATYTIELPFVVQDGIFDFSAYNYGSNYETGTVKVQSGTWTAGNVTMTTAGRNCWYLENDNTKTLRLYKTKDSDAGGSLTFTVPSGYIITKIEFEGKNVSQVVENVGSYTYSEDKKTGTWTGSNDEVTFSASSSTDTQIFTKATITYEQGTSKQNATVSISSTELEVNGEVATATVTTDGPDVTLTTSDEAVASVSGTTVTAVGAGTATITATWDGNDTFNAGSKTFIVTVTDNTPVNSDWVKAELAELTTEDIFVIVGKDSYAMANNLVSNTQPAAVAVNVSGNYLTGTIADNIKWNVSGNATDGYTFHPNGDATNYLYCSTTAASGSNTNMRVGTQTSNIRNLFVLDEDNLLVTKDSYTARYVSLNVTTDWRGYVNTNQSTPISFYKYVGAPLPSITADAVDIAFDATSGSISYTIEDGVDGGVLTASTTDEWLTLETATADAVPFTTSANEVLDARTATVTLTYTYGNSQTTTKTVTITQAGDPNAKGSENNPYTVTEALAVINTLADGGKTKSEVYVTGVISAIDEVALYNPIEDTGFGNATYFISDDGATTSQLEVYRGYYLESAKFTAINQIQAGDKVVIYGKLQKFVKDEVTTPEIASGNYIVSQAVSVTLNGYGYSTLYYSNRAFTVPEGVTATTYNDNVEVSTTYEAGGVIPANEAVVLQGPANAEVSFVVTTTTATPDPDNALKGLDEADQTQGEGKFYMLSATGGKVGFYWGSDGGAAFNTGAHKAYLVIPASKAKEAYYLNDEVTGIEKIDNTQFSTDKVYNLNGQRVDKNYKGVVIVNGKKMINK